MGKRERRKSAEFNLKVCHREGWVCGFFFSFSIPCILEHRRAAARHLRLFLSHLIAQMTIGDQGEKENLFHLQSRQTGA